MCGVWVLGINMSERKVEEGRGRQRKVDEGRGMQRKARGRQRKAREKPKSYKKVVNHVIGTPGPWTSLWQLRAVISWGILVGEKRFGSGSGN
jgi:hypothetical protein